MSELPKRMLELPELPKCPYHGDKPPEAIASCQICWSRFYIPFEFTPQLTKISFAVHRYNQQVERAKQYIALRADGFETDAIAPKDTLVVFALPDGGQLVGREIDNLMGGTYPVQDNAAQTPIQAYLGWKRVC